MADRNIALFRSLAAQRILSAAGRGITPIDTVVAVTMTPGASAANSTLLPSATIAKGQGMYNPGSPEVEQPIGKLNETAAGWSTSGDQPPTCVRTCTDSKNFEVCIQTDDVIDSAAFKYGLMAYVTDVRTGVRARIAANDFVTDTAYGWRWVLLTFPDNRPRIVEWHLSSGSTMRGICVDPGYTIWRAPRVADPKIAMCWDSFGQNALDYGPGSTVATNRVRQGTVDYIAEGMGVPMLISASRGQTGFLAGQTTVNYRGRLNAGKLDVSAVGNLDMLIIPGSLNDNQAAYDATLQAEVTATIQLAMQKQPDAIIVSTGPQRTWNGTAGSNTPQTRYDMVRDGFGAAAGGDPRMIYIDNSPQGENWYGSDGRNALIFGVNAGTTPLHPNNLGKVYVGRRMANSIVAAVQARFGR